MFRKHKMVFLVLSLVCVLALVSGCGGAADGEGDAAKMPESIKIGFLGPITGANASEGSAARNAFQLAFDQVNASGDLPYKVEVVALDDASKPETAASSAQKLVSDTEVLAISGHWNSPVAEATIPICKQSECPLLIWGAIGASLTSEANYPIVTRVASTDTQENIPLAQYVIEKLGYKNFFIISDTTSYGKSNTAAFQAEMANYGATSLGIEEVQTGTTDFRSILAKVKAAKPDAIFFGGVSQEGGLVARQMKELGMKDILLCGISGICAEDFITAGGATTVEGTFAITPGMDMNKTDAGKAFLAAYAAAGYKEPIGAFTPYAYQAAEVIIQALKDIEGAPSRALLIDAIKNSSTDGVLGNTTFDSIGQNTNPITTAMVCQDGKWVEYDSSEYATGVRTLPGLPGK